MIKASIIISFYNNLYALEKILIALENQNDGSFEAIISDDGSNQESIDEIKTYSDRFSFPIQHIWHEDKGFRKNRILNKSVIAAKNEYLIFIDADCVPQAHFVADHLQNAQKNTTLSGRRADISQKISEKINNEHPELFFKRNFWSILLDYLLGNGKNIEKGIRVSNSFISKQLNKKEKGIVGCNFSLFKKDILKINGFDERYEGAGIGEDSDVEFRLKLAGIQVKNLFYLANQIHIYHEELPRPCHNHELFSQVKKLKQAYTPFGIKKTQ
ncbi:Putative two-domain glycosyltransferase [Photobacterium marinum]|uniref:Putative two-domain glycosyltransferase n=1 Tax=Photobacterium marinum TaxID=1056511 RepID=L8J5F6_9GAMM|nr:glycosyltransferase [Photobacterium marinum]ELR63996.1 Putative two-domain glycosyltransferase [Photobacterium marinum]